MANTTLKVRNRIATKTSAEWEKENPILLKGEMGYDSTNKRYKIGDGVNTWNKLKYDIDLGVISKGQQLIINGNGVLGDNTNFSQMTYDPTISFNGSPGVFTISKGLTLKSDEFIPIDCNKKYKLSLDIQSIPDTISTFNFMMLILYDIDKKDIISDDHMYFAGSTTKLARDLNPGDTEIYVDDLSGWAHKTQSSARKIIFWDYKNSYGYQYPKETYSKYWKRSIWTEESQLDYVNNKIILDSPWDKEPHLAGCDISQSSNGNTYKFLKYSNISTLTHWEGYIQEFDYSGTNIINKFPPGTAFAKFGMLLNYNKVPNVKVAISNIRLEEVTEDLRYPLTLFNKTYNGTTSLSIAPSDVVGAMEDGNTDITDNTEFITSNVNGFNYSGSVNIPYRRKATYIWNWIKSKLSANAITTTGVTIPNGTASQVLLANGSTNTIKTINNQPLLGSGNIDVTQLETNIADYNSFNTEGNEWFSIPFHLMSYINQSSENLTTLLSVENSTPLEDKIIYNPILNLLSTNISAWEGWGKLIGNSSDDPNRWIYLVDILNFFLDDKDNLINDNNTNKSWLKTLTANTAPTKSISTMISEEIAKVVANAPASFDTLKEIADWISTHQNDASAMNTAINTNTTNITNLTTQVNTNTTNISTNATQINDIKGDITNINSILQSLTNEINTLKTELQNAKAEIAYLKSVAPVVTAENGFYVVDGNGNIGFKVDENGATDSATTNIDTTNVD